MDDFDDPRRPIKSPMSEFKRPPILTSIEKPPAPPVSSTGKWILFGTIILTIIAVVVFAVLCGIVFWFCTDVGKLPI